MISKTRSFLDSRNLIGVLILLSAFAAVAGCSSTTNTGGLVDASGNHPTGFVSTHPGPASPDGGACKECHGSDLRGGIVNVSCFSASRNGVACHASGPAGHPSGWAAALGAPQPHGSAARAANGFVGCQACHGTGTTPPANFGGGTSTISCYPCHVPTASSPHASAWRTGDTFVHTTTDPSNAQVCAQCHVNGASSPIPPPSPPAPAGTAPGCFNSTLCHGEGGVPHPVDNTWVTTSPASQPHGNDAKAAPGTTTGFDYCQVCHGAGTEFAGGSSNVSCYPCHGNVGTPHPSQWRTGDTYVHTSTAGGNAPVCAFCHTAGANSPIAPPPAPAPGATPDCFNNTLCHGPGFHPAGWAQFSQHGTAAKAIPSASGGFSYCQACHGTGTTPPANFGGGTEGPSCYPCHGVSAPHPAGATWRGGGTPTHRSTNQAQSNLDVCAQCHRSATPGTVGCFNNTLCHN